MIVLGLTGSIGMGKSTAARMLRRLGCPVHDADAAVHRLYAPGGAAVGPIGAVFPEAVVDGGVDRTALSRLVVGKPDALRRLEEIVHPLVRRETDGFLERARASGARVAVLDIPLLYETGGEGRVDKVLVVSAPAEVQRARVLARPGMDAAKLDAILARQVPDAEKRRRADFVVETGLGRRHTLRHLAAIVRMLAGQEQPGPERPDPERPDQEQPE
ncbi:MAG TPA: dephospho-CoA kinase [Azospirillaceae bacterium]|nr:dephospho-CoA kinase [Azospirillaceae bacterium]